MAIKSFASHAPDSGVWSAGAAGFGADAGLAGGVAGFAGAAGSAGFAVAGGAAVRGFTIPRATCARRS